MSRHATSPPTVAAAAPHLETDLLAVLAEPTRARVVEALAQESLCTCHLVELTGATQSNVSNHLRVLRDAGVVVGEPAGRFTYYRLVPQTLAGLSDALADLARRAAAAGRRPC